MLPRLALSDSHWFVASFNHESTVDRENFVRSPILISTSLLSSELLSATLHTCDNEFIQHRKPGPYGQSVYDLRFRTGDCRLRLHAFLTARY